MDSELDCYRVVVLAGGVGGAKFAHGLAQLLPPENLTIIVNTGDDFQHLGLTICPDLDTVMYTLSGHVNPESGWGRAGESWRTLEEVKRLEGPDWFRIGDLDLATHLVRSQLLADGFSLTDATLHLCLRFGLTMRLLPMSDQKAPTMIDSDAGVLGFQEWFVAEKWQPTVNKILLPEVVRATPAVMAALEEADIVAIAPSNPFVSIDPILNVYPIREMVSDLPSLVLGVTPIIAGKAIKGPAAKLMRELGLEVSAGGVAHYYDELLDLFVYDEQDQEPDDAADLILMETNTLMPDAANRKRLASEIMNHALELLER